MWGVLVDDGWMGSGWGWTDNPAAQTPNHHKNYTHTKHAHTNVLQMREEGARGIARAGAGDEAKGGLGLEGTEGGDDGDEPSVCVVFFGGGGLVGGEG